MKSGEVLVSKQGLDMAGLDLLNQLDSLAHDVLSDSLLIFPLEQLAQSFHIEVGRIVRHMSLSI